jgi:hypothetical protein
MAPRVSELRRRESTGSLAGDAEASGKPQGKCGTRRGRSSAERANPRSRGGVGDRGAITSVGSTAGRSGLWRAVSTGVRSSQALPVNPCGFVPLACPPGDSAARAHRPGGRPGRGGAEADDHGGRRSDKGGSSRTSRGYGDNSGRGDPGQAGQAHAYQTAPAARRFRSLAGSAAPARPRRGEIRGMPVLAAIWPGECPWP